MINYYMEEAINQAKKAYKNGEIPVGAVIVYDNKIIAKSYNKVEKEKIAVSHAEINAIKIAAKKLKNWRLLDCDMYVTLEPCPMCSWAIKLSRIRNVYYCTSKSEDENNKYLVISTKCGLIKRTNVCEFENIRKNGKIDITL